MDLSAAAWAVIVFALIAANLPFVVQRPLIALPWAWCSDDQGPGRRCLRSLVFFVLLAAWIWGTMWLIGGAFAGGGNTALLFVLKLILVCALAAGLLALPGWRTGQAAASSAAAPVRGPSGAATPATSSSGPSAGASALAPAKPSAVRLLEVLVCYVLVGTLGVALELNLGNAFARTWEFYAVTFSLFLVLGYPGFVFRYMLKRRKAPAARGVMPRHQ